MNAMLLAVCLSPTPARQSSKRLIIPTHVTLNRRGVNRNISLLSTIFGVLLLLNSMDNQAKEIIKCTGVDGTVYYSDTGCPANENAKIDIIEIPESTPDNYDPRGDYYSIENQATRMREERLRKEAEQAETRLHMQVNLLRRQASSRYELAAESEKFGRKDQAELLRKEAREYRNQANELLGIKADAWENELVDDSNGRTDKNILEERKRSKRRNDEERRKTSAPRGAVNPVTGEFYAPAGGGNLVGTRDGTLYTPAGPNGYINTRNGQFVPAH